MKKFEWRLQRLLDIKIKQEDVMRAELVAITERAVSVRSQIMLQQAALRGMLAELGQKEPAKRVGEQEFFLKYVHVTDMKIKTLQHKLAELEILRQNKIKEIIKLRKFRKGLEKLRDEAKVEYMKEQEKYEQKELDDSTSMSFARKIIQHA